MKRLPRIAVFVLFIALCVSVAYWAMQLFKPPLRPVAAPSQSPRAEARPDAAAALFGGRAAGMTAAGNFELKGVVVAGRPGESVAIIAASGKPAKALGIDAEVVPGVTIKEVHRQYVLLSEGGVTRRVDLPESAKSQSQITTAPVPRVAVPVLPPQPSPAAPATVVNPAAAVNSAQPQGSTQQPTQPTAPAIVQPAPGTVQPAQAAPNIVPPSSAMGTVPAAAPNSGVPGGGHPGLVE
ncbi:MAG TPA: type II secretion system protein N [Burkholderiaceae bacterium]|nr:type II secretion system protein N [Burkholderiaceae bacterium]